MIQRLAHWLGGVALNWFYSDVRVVNGDRIPASGPILVAMNHQNALIDALLALWIVPRELRITAKATLGDTMAGAVLMKSIGIIPLRRVVDNPAAPDPMRNRHAFEAMIEELKSGGAILVFPEGKSHNEPEVAPLKTGLARAALRARKDGVGGIKIIPIGITFEDKATPGTRVIAQVGEPVAMDDWPGEDARELTESIAARLRSVSILNVSFGQEQLPTIRRNWLVSLAAWWGRLVHELPLRLARRRAVRLSADPGEPAMYTMTFGFGAILVSYAVEVTIVKLLFGWVVSTLFLVSLITGAYWAAYANHPDS
ncbi:MAG: 1-acyl-sn-glycerol-3-phosphate acyltransferase [Gemmatimonadaceae bacterium]